MRKLLRWFLGFLDRRFPEKVTVTKKDYDDLRVLALQFVDEHNKLSERVEKLEVSVRSHSAMMGLGATGKFIGQGLER